MKFIEQLAASYLQKRVQGFCLNLSVENPTENGSGWIFGNGWNIAFSRQHLAKNRGEGPKPDNQKSGFASLSGTTFAIVLFVLSLFLLLTQRPVKADDSNEVPPYEVANLPIQVYTAKVYKTVHQGCEIFVAMNGVNSISIATGRGCK